MKIISFIIVGILIISLFTIGYYYVLDKINYGVISYNEYINNPECEFEKLDDGWTQISNCAKYKFKGFNKI